jgi:aryl-alcohol dehydrogenase-like predicted oxidoreductase
LKLALGTVQFGLPYGIANQVGQVVRTEANAILKLALAKGIDTLDTAMPYGDAEKCLGEVGTQGFNLVTKLPVVPEGCTDVSNWVQQQVSASLSRLGVVAVYGLLLHRPEQLLGSHGPALYKALQVLKDNGQVEKVGASIYSPNELEALTLRYRFDLVQAPFNLVDRRLYSTGWMQRLKDADIEIHTRSTFLQGLLLMTQDEMPPKFTRWSNLWHIWYQWLTNTNVSAVNACLSFPLLFSEIDRVIVGVDSQNQLSQIVKATICKYNGDLPNLQCEDQNLINPSNWPKLSKL